MALSEGEAALTLQVNLGNLIMAVYFWHYYCLFDVRDGGEIVGRTAQLRHPPGHLSLQE